MPATTSAPAAAPSKQDVFNLVFAYSDFWRSPTFRKGYEVAPFSFDDVRPLLERAATIVVAIRADLDAKNPNVPRRRIDGAASEYLVTLKSKNPNRDADKFVRNVVHATLRNSAGFVEGLTAERVDEYIARFDPAGAHDAAANSKLEKLLDEVTVAWGEACTIVGTLLAHDRKTYVQELSRWDIPKLELLVSDLKNITHNSAICSVAGTGVKQARRRKHKKAATATAEAAPEEHADHEDHTTGDEGAPFGEGATMMKEFPIAVRRTEMDIDSIHKEIATLTNTYVTDDAIPEMMSHPDSSAPAIQAMISKCQAFMDTLRNDVAVIKGAHLPAALETTEISHLEEAAKEVAATTRRLARLGARLDETSKAQHDAESSAKEAAEVANRMRSALKAAFAARQAQEAEEKKLAEEHVKMLEEMREWFRAVRLEPRIDIHDEGDKYVLQAFVPNIREEDLDINVHDGILLMKGFRAPTDESLDRMISAVPQPPTKEAILKMGMGKYGTFADFFKLPEDVDAIGVTGTYEHGEMHVVLPKKAKAIGASLAHAFLHCPVGTTSRRVLHQTDKPVTSACTRTPGLFGARRAEEQGAAGVCFVDPVTGAAYLVMEKTTTA